MERSVTPRSDMRFAPLHARIEFGATEKPPGMAVLKQFPKIVCIHEIEKKMFHPVPGPASRVGVEPQNQTVAAILSSWNRGTASNSPVRVVLDDNHIPWFQLRVPCGIEQIAINGRPDGATYHGFATALEGIESRLAEGRTVDQSDFEALAVEVGQIKGRLNIFKRWGDCEGVIRDARYLLRAWERMFERDRQMPALVSDVATIPNVFEVLVREVAVFARAKMEFQGGYDLLDSLSRDVAIWRQRFVPAISEEIRQLFSNAATSVHETCRLFYQIAPQDAFPLKRLGILREEALKAQEYERIPAIDAELRNLGGQPLACPEYSNDVPLEHFIASSAGQGQGYDLGCLLSEWGLAPGESGWRIVCVGPNEKVLQKYFGQTVSEYRLSGRPDGATPCGRTSYLDHCRVELEEGRLSDLGAEEVEDLGSELALYFERGLGFYNLKDFERAVLDLDHTFAIIGIVSREASSQQLEKALDGTLPSLVLWKVKINAEFASTSGNMVEAKRIVGAGIEQMRRLDGDVVSKEQQELTDLLLVLGAS